MLLLNDVSDPRGRLVSVLAAELGIKLKVKVITAEQIDLMEVSVNSCGLPVLLLEDGNVIYDSRVICSYLASLRPGKCMIPVGDRWHVHVQWALCMEMITLGILLKEAQTRCCSPMVDAVQDRLFKAMTTLESFATDLCAVKVRIDRLAAYVTLEFLSTEMIGDLERKAPKLMAWYLEKNRTMAEHKECSK